MKNVSSIKESNLVGLKVLILAMLFLASCNKDEETTKPSSADKGITKPSRSNQSPGNPSDETISCEVRPVINARLIPIGKLSSARIGLVSAAAGNKIVFAGGFVRGGYSSEVDIYDIPTNTWSTADLSKAERQGMVTATVGTKIFFAGGGDNDNGITTSRVDIYDVSNNTWTTAELSKAREYLAAATLGNKIYFAGGGNWEPHLIGSRIVDIYDNATNTWSMAFLSKGRMDLSATSTGNKIYFAGGTSGYYTSLNFLKTIDIYDGVTNSWSTSTLQEVRGDMASIAVGDKIYWASGINSNSFGHSIKVEILDVDTGISTYSCMIPKSGFKAVVKDDKIVFFTGRGGSAGSLGSTRFEIFNTTSNTWSTGVLPQEINDATIISVNNTLYVAGGRDITENKYYDQVWKMEF
jgi:hypothetical protein